MEFTDYENDIETIALVIEDLKSEDPTIKVQAVSKLYSVAQIIGTLILIFTWLKHIRKGTYKRRAPSLFNRDNRRKGQRR